MSTELFTLALIGFASSFGHCIGMCGGLTVAYSSTKITPNMTKAQQFVRHILYHLGRTSTYAILGAAIGLIGSAAILRANLFVPMHIFAGVVMILTALAMLGLSKAFISIEYSLHKFALFKKTFSFLIKSQNISSFFALGMLNGLFPCGLVYFFLAKASTANSSLDGATIMIAFGLSTLPALTLFGSSIALLRNIAFRTIVTKICAVIVLGYGIYTILKGFSVL